MYDRNGLLGFIQERFQCDWYGLHGIKHWQTVASHGRVIGKLHELNKSNLLIIELFSYLHDSCRQNEGVDSEHGLRAANMAAELNNIFYSLNPSGLNCLSEAIAKHSLGFVSNDPVIQTCWDADRLDLVRVGIEPSEYLLSDVANSLVGIKN